MASMWPNCLSRRAKAMTAHSRCSLVSRAVWPILRFRCGRWPFSPTMAQAMDAWQQHLYALVLRIPKLSIEEPGEYNRRRYKLARSHCTKVGWWSREWSLLVREWNAHMERHPEHWGYPLLAYKDGPWLMARRLAASVGSALAGSTGTRAAVGHPCQRWHDGIGAAAEWWLPMQRF